MSPIFAPGSCCRDLFQPMLGGTIRYTGFRGANQADSRKFVQILRVFAIAERDAEKLKKVFRANHAAAATPEQRSVPTDILLIYKKAVSSKLRNLRLCNRSNGISLRRSIARMPICKCRATCVL